MVRRWQLRCTVPATWRCANSPAL